MCGIAGLVWKAAARPAEAAQIADMCDAIVHRGPDGGGIHLDGQCGLGHRRLAIVDPSPAGAQPMVSADGRYVLVYNGEIYNHVELRDQLTALGARFHTRTDSEVLLEAFRVWGASCLERFNGMWAFVILDTFARELFIARDRLGIKPFYYCDGADRFAFASEIKGILAVWPEQRRPDLAYLGRFLPGGLFDDGPETCFAGVRSLPPGHAATFRIDAGSLRLWRWWDPDPGRFADRVGSRPVETLAALLDSAVRLHLRSDVPVGVCLSGGVDSSALTCLAARHLAGPVNVFSAIYSDRGCDEAEFVALVNRHVPTRAVAVRPEPDGDLVDDLARISWHQDEPTAGPGLYSQYHVMRSAHETVKVLLDGQGSDELFAGYLFYFRSRLLDLIARGRAGRLAALALYARARAHWTDQSLGAPGAFVLGALGRRLGRSASASTAPALLHPELEAQVAVSVFPRETDRHAHGHLPALLRSQLLSTCLPALLHYEDRNSMAFGIESRVPFLDHRIVEFALALDVGMKMRGTWTKWVLRRAVAPVVPRQVAWRRSKLGYPTPMARWLRRDPDRRQVRDVLFDDGFLRRSLVRPQAIQGLWDEHQSGHRDHSWMLYRLITTELWHRQFIDGWRPAPAPCRRPVIPTAPPAPATSAPG